ncbi:beta-galactosidase [Bryocella elongata]|uniref:Beta-galactosidase n=1 Tax=Bryocella elongata TaxID=863522 RepID=A0A1H6ACQ6_9BACT|nr:beta-galactosidase [Bryocella elongata]SEG46080.1 beta-galactosidase [Bryocella elongata]
MRPTKPALLLRASLRTGILLATSAALAGGVTPISRAQRTAAAPPPPPLMLGDAWYPEQWPESRWEADLTLMQQAHIQVVRIAEFAWSSMEPSEGVYKLDWLERAVNMAGKHGIYTVLGTPTAAPPAWLTQKYPQTLRVDANGKRDEHGGRQQFSFDDPKYRVFAHEIAQKMAEKLGHNPYVIGWQIDNELAADSFDEGTQKQFQQWLKKKYGTLDNLNTRWTTSYWSETFQDWSQIPLPKHNGVDAGNPGLMLNWRLFVSDTWRSYLKNQIDAIRPLADKRQWITTNTMGYFDQYDHYVTEDILDIAAWDDYMGDGKIDQVRNGFAHDMARGFKRKNFWVMETQPGFVNWYPVNIALKPGDERALIWHDIAHGADAVSFWQWRSALNGQEQYHGVLVGADGTPVPVYDEIKRTGEELDRLAPVLAGTTPHADVAMLYSYESRWAIEWQKHTNKFDSVEEIARYYAPLRRATQSVDVLSPDADLSQYKLVIAPAFNLVTQKQADHLMAYVKAGGNLVLTARSAMKDEDNSLWPARQPGPFVSMLGGRVEQFYALDKPVAIEGATAAPGAEATIWAEQLSTSSPKAEVLLHYGEGNGWLTGHPAVIQNKVGAGSITYIGAVLDAKTTASLVDALLAQAHATPAEIAVPEGVEASTRYSDHTSVHILINLSDKPQTVALPRAMKDELNGGQAQSVSLPISGVAVLSEVK